MAVDISKVFKSNIKAIRMNQSDGSEDKENILNEELLKKNNKKNQNKTTTTTSISKDAKNIVGFLNKSIRF